MKNFLVYLSLIATATFWGANFNVGKIAITILPPMSVIAWRFILAALLMLIILYIKEGIVWGAIRQNIWLYVLLGVIGIFGMNGFLFIGLNHTSAINASLIMATNPIVAVILSVLFLKEGIRFPQGICMLISLSGVMLVLTGGTLNKLGSISEGDILVLLGNICWALYGVLNRRFVKNSTPLATSTYTMVIGAICLLPFAFTGYKPIPGNMAMHVVYAVVFMALFGSVLSYLWWNRGIARIGVNKTSIFFNLVPVATMVIAYFSGQNVEAAQILGAVLVIFGVISSTLTSKKSVKSRQFAHSADVQP